VPISVILPPQPGQLSTVPSSVDPHQLQRTARGRDGGGGAVAKECVACDVCIKGDGGGGAAAAGASCTFAGAPQETQKRASAGNLDPQVSQNMAVSPRYSVLWCTYMD